MNGYRILIGDRSLIMMLLRDTQRDGRWTVEEVGGVLYGQDRYKASSSLQLLITCVHNFCTAITDHATYIHMGIDGERECAIIITEIFPH